MQSVILKWEMPVGIECGSRMAIVEITFSQEALAKGLYLEPDPPLESGAPIVVAFEGAVWFGVWTEDCLVFPWDHQVELEKEAADLLIKELPGIDLQSSVLRVFTCPQELADRLK